MTHTHSLTHSLALSLSLSHTHTHTPPKHTCCFILPSASSPTNGCNASSMSNCHNFSKVSALVHLLHTATKEATFENAGPPNQTRPATSPKNKNSKVSALVHLLHKVNAESNFENFCLHLPGSLSLSLLYFNRALLPKFRDFHLLLCLILKKIK